MKRWILVAIFMTAPLAQAQLECSDALTAAARLKQFHAKTGNQLEKLISDFSLKMNPLVLSGETAPKWSDFDGLSTILENAKLFKDSLKGNPETLAELNDLSRELKKQLLETDVIKKLLVLNSAPYVDHPYVPTEYELKKAYQYYVRELNRILPRELRIPVRHLPADQRMANINIEAAQYLKVSEEKFAAKFATSPNGTIENYVRGLRASTDPSVIKALELIDKDQIQVTMRRPVSARFWVPKVGFHNQFVTGTSKGTLNATSRNTAEANLYNQEKVDDYALRDNEFKPKYGTLAVKPESGLKSDLGNSNHYGPDLYIFKTENIQDRLTFFPADSLGPGMRSQPELETTPWDTFFIPWKYRLLMVPFLLSSLPKSFFGPPKLNPLISATERYMSYWESQILGTVRLDDVAIFAFTQDPPEGEFLRELQTRHIQIRQFNIVTGVFEDWTPPAIATEDQPAT